jgi:hypothetical protein
MTKISQLTNIGSALAGDDEFVVRDASDIFTPNKKVTSSGIIDYIISQGGVSGFSQIAAGVGPLARVQATSSGTTGTIVFSTAAATTLLERARIDSAGRLLIGTTSSLQVAGVDSHLQLEGFTAVNAHALSAIRHGGGTAAAGAVIALARSRGTTVGSVTAVQNGDTLATLTFNGANGTDFSNAAAAIIAQVDGEPFTAGDTTDLPGRLVFSTTADGSSGATERMRITSGGNVAIGKTSASYKLDATEARIGDGYIVYSATLGKTGSTTHTATITFGSQASFWEPKHVEIIFTGSAGAQNTTYAGIARYMFTTITSLGSVTELEDSGNGVSFAATTSGMDLVVTATTTSNNTRIGFVARIACGGPTGLPTGMVIT